MPKTPTLQEQLNSGDSLKKQAKTLVWYIKNANSENEAIEHTHTAFSKLLKAQREALLNENNDSN